MRFETLWPWLCVPPLLFYLWWLARRSYAQLAPAARWIGLSLRAAIIILLVAAISRPSYLKKSDQDHLVFVLDVSKSITPVNLDAALADIDRLAREAEESAMDLIFSVIAFGQDAEIIVRQASQWPGWRREWRERIEYQKTLPKLYEERTRSISSGDADRPKGPENLEERIAAAERLRDKIAGEHTNLESALRLAMSMGSEDQRRTIYVFTDANFNRGNWQEAWRHAQQEALELHLVSLDKTPPPEVAVTEVLLPASVRINQGFSADLRVSATQASVARLHIYKDGFAVNQREIMLTPGDNMIKVSGLYFREKGFHTVEVTVKVNEDGKLENNSCRSLIVVPGSARVLYIDADEDQIPYLKGALELEGMQVEARPTAGVPQRLSELLSFDALILSNVPADRLGLRQMQMIRSYVQEFGGGFVMLGGDESFGLGGYFNTPIEEILPVRMPIRKDMIRPSLGIMLVIDKSGSMSGVKIQLAKRAAVATSEAINPRDQIGVIGFDGESRVILELTPAADRATIASLISGLEAGGGTFLYPALQDAHSRLLESTARRKHVIVLSDGQTQGFGYEELVQMMSVDGITLSTVGIGEGADMQLMEAIALAGGGRAYFTDDFFSIPQIFTREALRASNSMLVERLVEPVAVGDDVCLEEINTDELPLLTGYVATTPKDAANVILASDSGDPLLAKWRSGLGRTVAFTSETKPRWAEDWLDWPDFAKFWSQLIRSVTGEELAKQFDLEVSHYADGDGVVLVADVRDADGSFLSDLSLSLSTVAPNGRKTSLPVECTGPGMFEARLPRIEYGRDQQFIWEARGEAAEPRTVPYGFVYSFSPEFRTLRPARDVIEQIAQYKSGRAMSVGESQLVLSQISSAARAAMWPFLLVAALLLVPADILVRRTG